MSLLHPPLDRGPVYPLPNLLAMRDHLGLEEGPSTSLFIQPVGYASDIRNRKVISCYIAALPREPATAEPNPWILVLETADASAIVFELRQADPRGRTVVVCREAGTAVLDSELGTCARSWLAVHQGSVVGDWLDILERSGGTRYRLISGFGCRWWLDCVLTLFSGFFAAGNDMAKTWLRMAWTGTSEPVYPGEQQRFERGEWLWPD